MCFNPPDVRNGTGRIFCALVHRDEGPEEEEKTDNGEMYVDAKQGKAGGRKGFPRDSGPAIPKRKRRRTETERPPEETIHCPTPEAFFISVVYI